MFRRNSKARFSSKSKDFVLNALILFSQKYFEYFSAGVKKRGYAAQLIIKLWKFINKYNINK